MTDLIKIFLQYPDAQTDLEHLLTQLSGGETSVGTLRGRMAVARYCGYFDARAMVFFHETHGLPLSFQVIEIAKLGLKIDFLGLRYELERIGKKPTTIESELQELHSSMEESARLR